jgi:hypothetical protein
MARVHGITIDRNGNGTNHGVGRKIVVEEAVRAGYRLLQTYEFVKDDGMDYFSYSSLHDDMGLQRCAMECQQLTNKATEFRFEEPTRTHPSCFRCPCLPQNCAERSRYTV